MLRRDTVAHPGDHVGDSKYPRIEVTPFWARITDQLVEVVDALTDQELDQRPAPGVWSVRDHMVHLIGGRVGLMDAQMHEVDPRPADWVERCRTREGLKEQLVASWARMERFLASESQLEQVYTPPPVDAALFRGIAEGPPDYPTEPGPDTGHFIAYHRLVHDVHHRACIFNVVERLGITLHGVRRLHPL